MAGFVSVFHVDIIEVSDWVSDVPNYLSFAAAASLADHPYHLFRGQGFLLLLLLLRNTFSFNGVALFADTNKRRNKKGESSKGCGGHKYFRVGKLGVEYTPFLIEG